MKQREANFQAVLKGGIIVSHHAGMRGHFVVVTDTAKGETTFMMKWEFVIFNAWRKWKTFWEKLTWRLGLADWGVLE